MSAVRAFAECFMSKPIANANRVKLGNARSYLDKFAKPIAIEEIVEN